MLALPWISFGCQEPFGADRHDLRGFRIAAVTAEVEQGLVRPTAAVIVDGKLWSGSAVELDWSFIDAAGDTELEPEPVATGPAVELPVASGRLALHAHLDGRSAWAELDLEQRTQFETTMRTERIERDVATLAVADLTREARRTWTSSPATVVPPNGILRVIVDGAPPAARGRFMATGTGTYFELEANEADWMAAEVTIDDEDITVEPVQPGVQSLLVASIDTYASGFSVADVQVGEPSAGVWSHGRLLPAAQSATGRVWARAARDDEASAGIRLEDLVAADPTATWDPAGVGCVGVTGPFDPNWLLTGACGRDTLLGERLLLELHP